MLKGKKSLAETHPEVARQWHPTKNGNLTPFDIGKSSDKKVWWKCDQGDDHEYLISPSKRVYRNQGCSICSGSKIVKSNCLATTHPTLSKEWHPTKNGNLKPTEIGSRSSKKVWWKCDMGDDHEWIASVGNRSNGGGCSVCYGRTIVKSNCLATTHPEIAKQWHPKKNKHYTPENIGGGSGKKFWWKCEKDDDHIWLTSVVHRTKSKSDCPYCSNQKTSKKNNLEFLYPKIAAEWHPALNGNLKPKEVLSGSGKKIWWKCDIGDDHIWEASISHRTTNESGCPICTGHKVAPSTSIKILHPELVKEWHPTLNKGKDPVNYSSGSNEKIWWKCEKGEDHIWQTSIHNRVSSGNNCPICANQMVVLSNCLATTHPEIAKQWHPTKNRNLKPNDVTPGSGKRVWWKCDKGDDHEWSKVINGMVEVSSCPFCCNQKVSKSNNLKVKFSKIASEWHPTKNGNLKPENFIIGSGKKIWWQCLKSDDHVWYTTIGHRTSGRNCPYCDLTPQSKQELIITFELKKLFRNIDPKGFKTSLNGRLRAIDIFIPKLNLCIEFDGSYWHKDKRNIDKIKSEMLFDKGFKLIRVREEPLKKIYDTDVISKRPYDGKKVTNDILSKIINIFNLDNKLVSKIKDYQLKDKLQNEKALERYIDKILTEKVEKKSN